MAGDRAGRGDGKGSKVRRFEGSKVHLREEQRSPPCPNPGSLGFLSLNFRTFEPVNLRTAASPLPLCPSAPPLPQLSPRNGVASGLRGERRRVGGGELALRLLAGDR